MTQIAFAHHGIDSDSGVAVLEKNEYRTARVNEPVVSMQVKMLEPVRDAAKKIAAAHDMTAQQYVEYLIVETLNKNERAIEEGEKKLEQFNGSTAANRRHAERLELQRFRESQGSSIKR